MAVTYCTEAEVTTYCTDSGVTVPASAPLVRLINRAERDIDSIVGLWAQTETVGSHTLPTATITVDSTYRIPASGTILVAGQAVAYTAKTLSTFTGATGGTGEIAEGSPVLFRSASGLKFDPVSQLAAVQAAALSRATCAQAEYRLQMGEPFFIEGQYSQVSGPDFSQHGQLPRVGPKAWQELQGFGLLTETYVG